MIIYCNGDSFVSGSELIDHIYGNDHPGFFKEPQLHLNPKIRDWFNHNLKHSSLSFSVREPLEKERTFPSKIHSMTNINVINDGLGGSSMDRIVRTSITKLTELINTDEQEIVAVIGTTEMNRFELPNTDINWTCAPHNISTTPELREAILKYYAINETDYHQYVKFYLNVIQLQDFCKVNNIKLYWLRALPESGVQGGPTVHEFISNLNENNDLVQLVKYAKFKYTLSMEELASQVEYPYCPGGHFVEEVHELVAKKIIELLHS